MDDLMKANIAVSQLLNDNATLVGLVKEIREGVWRNDDDDTEDERYPYVYFSIQVPSEVGALGREDSTIEYEVKVVGVDRNEEGSYMTNLNEISEEIKTALQNKCEAILDPSDRDWETEC